MNPGLIPTGVRRRKATAGYTLVEMLMAFGIGSALMGGTATFMFFAAKASSGITSQTMANQQAAHAIELIEDRVRLATLVSNDVTGNILTLGFDTNNLADSGNGGNGVAWGNQDYFEQFKFVGANTTNFAACTGNQLIYIPNTTSTNCRVLISSGVRNLPGHSVFFVTNTVLATICFGVVDVNPQDNYEHIEIQAMAASLNRPQVNTMVTILPAP
jgi:type II secretory pathway pseudopilin PulG